MDRTPESSAPRPSSPDSSTDHDGAAPAAPEASAGPDGLWPPDAAAVRSILADVQAAGTAIGLPLESDAGGELLRTCLPMPGGREQQVFVRVSGRLASGLHVLTIFSPCHRLPVGVRPASELLRHLLLFNEGHRFVRVALWPMNDGELVVTSWDQILETMEAEELGTQVRALALAADRLEQELDASGRDIF